jgi:lysosomal Pro-X carboxypeptidase
MLAYWIRQKYPHVIRGAIAASAPIRIFAGWEAEYEFQSESYWGVVTRDANATGGALPTCSANIRKAFNALISLGASKEGRQQLTETFRVCSTGSTPSLNSVDDVKRLYKLQLFTFDTLAMGNYPYPSNYLTQGGHILPAFPMREACKRLDAKLPHAFGSRDRPLQNTSQLELLQGLYAATAVVTNASTHEKCVPLPSADADDGQDCVLCDYFTCTNGNPLETEFVRDGVNDMFLPEAYDPTGPLGGVNTTAIEARCRRLYDTKPRWRRMSEAYGTADAVALTTNVFYSNGKLDQWSSGGVTWMNRTDSRSFLIDDAAHHLDLMFSHHLDPQSVVDARALERKYMHRWLQTTKSTSTSHEL